MKNKLQMLAVLCLVIPSMAKADCGTLPDAPELLEETQLSTQQVVGLESAMESFLQQIDSYKSCVETLVLNLAPADANEDYFDSVEYQTDFDNLMSLEAQANQHNRNTVDRYNYLLQIAVPQQ